MPSLRVDEEWARQIMEAELRLPVAQHDDGSKPGMHDLDVFDGVGRRAAVEVTAAVDPESTELWNIVNGRGRWVEPDLAGGWLVMVKPNARQLTRELPPFLRSLEHAGIRKFGGRAAEPTAIVSPPGIVKATQSGTDFPGSIYVLPDLPSDLVAGFMAETGDSLAAWIGDFLRDDARTDLRQKLARSGVAERHAFVVVSGLSGLSFAITGLLDSNDAPDPIAAPDLPPEVTDVWVASIWASGVGFRWSSATRCWVRFAKPPLQPSSPNPQGRNDQTEPHREAP
jgi:hypothetical protein